MKRWVLGIAGTHAIAAAVLLLVSRPWGLGGPPAALVGCTAAFALVGLVPMHLELRRHACTVVLNEAVLVVALWQLGPMAVVLAATVGEAVSCLVSRQRGLKLTFNVAAAMGANAVAAAVFARHGTHAASVLQTRGWLPMAEAVVAYAVVSVATTSAILAVAERRRFFDVLVASVPTVAVSTAASASLGLSAVVLAEADGLGPVLLLPLLGMVFMGTRRMAVQSAEHLRFQRLYEASSRTGQLVGFEDSLATLAAEARGLVTGNAAVCCGRRPDGSWAAVLVDDAGAGPAPAGVVEALLSIDITDCKPRTLAAADWPRALRAAVPGGADLVWCPPRLGAPATVGLAVFREIRADDQGDGRVEVLAAFSGHAALTMANALLYAEVEEALQHQIDLTRQKGDFLATVSHELRTPLTCVLGSVSTLRRCREKLGPADVDRLLGTALEQGDRLKRLIEDLLQVASAETGAMRPERAPVDATGVVAGVVGDLLGTSGHRLEAQVQPGCTGLRSDPHKLRQILTNLVENAIKYAPEGAITVMAQPSAGAVEFLVVDRGPGIPAVDRERVFERFVQLDQSSTRRQGGTGLGLYLCRQLAELLDGTLTLDEAAGGGCSFRLRLPVVPDDDGGTADPGVRVAGTSVLAAPAGV
ncbi:MAG TPA: HAMP domain-containing sensor histidine kinase [Acidimicrobiales bacterium]|jgi:signal transduction histidine kinase|nr:HAMP domain-containing sensor histidine kinase [Acidimicrobiales bacterium]